jgi:hypothetical protein
MGRRVRKHPINVKGKRVRYVHMSTMSNNPPSFIQPIGGLTPVKRVYFCPSVSKSVADPADGRSETTRRTASPKVHAAEVH